LLKCPISNYSLNSTDIKLREQLKKTSHVIVNIAYISTCNCCLFYTYMYMFKFADCEKLESFKYIVTLHEAVTI